VSTPALPRTGRDVNDSEYYASEIAEEGFNEGLISQDHAISEVGETNLSTSAEPWPVVRKMNRPHGCEADCTKLDPFDAGEIVGRGADDDGLHLLSSGRRCGHG